MQRGRVIEAHRTNFTITADGGEFLATVRGNFHAEGDFPKVGDYVLFEVLPDQKAVITEVVDRNSIIKRKSAGADEEQIIATNVDLMFVVMGLDGDFNINRLERYLLLAEQSGIEAVVILNKSDLVADYESLYQKAVNVSGDRPVLVTSATTGEKMEEILPFIKSDTTAVLLGSSGAGKSTITNWLLDENIQAVRSIREDDSHGRHTTTTRHLFVLPKGGFLIDTPGMRELGLVESEVEAKEQVFSKIEFYTDSCQFRNCDHKKSAGCAVLKAVEKGEISERELVNYHKLIEERTFSEDKNINNATRHAKQNKKRQQQYKAALERKRLSRR